MSNFHFEVPHNFTPKDKKINLIKDSYNYVQKQTSALRRTWPEYMVLKVKTVYRDNTFDLTTPDEEHLFERVMAIDPRAKDFYRPGKAVTVRFNNINGGRPYIKFGYGFFSDVVDLSTQYILYWTQSEANHLRNNSANEPATVFTFTSAGSKFYTYYSRVGSAHDIRSRVYGLVSFKEGTEPRLGLSYPRYVADGSTLDSHRIEVIDLAGTLIRTHVYDIATDSSLGTGQSDQMFLNSGNNHFWLTPIYPTDQVRIRAWNDGDNHILTSTSDRPNSQISVAFQKTLYPNFFPSYTGGEQTPVSPHVDYWPTQAINPLVLSYIGGYKTQGIVRSATETLTTWTYDPSTACTFTQSIMSHNGGTGTGWPASPSSDHWYMAVSERELLDITTAENAALGYGYLPIFSIPTSIIMNPSKYSHALNLHIVKIISDTGVVTWKKTISKTAVAALNPTTLFSLYNSYLATGVGPGPGGVIVSNGTIAENFLPSDTVDGFGAYTPNVWPGRQGGPSPAPQGVSFNWPSYTFFRGFNMRLMPHRANDVMAVQASSDTSIYYNGCLDNLLSFTAFGEDTDFAGAPNGESPPCGPGIFGDTDGNIYLSYMHQATFLKEGIIREDGDPLVGLTISHIPTVVCGWKTFQCSYDETGTLRWQRELTNYRTDMHHYFYADYYGVSTIIGDSAGVSLPWSGNVPIQVPVVDGTFLITVREVKTYLGADYRPDLILEVQDGATGTVLSTIFLPYSTDVFATDIGQDPGSGDIRVFVPGDTLLAVAGERKWYIGDVHVKAAKDSTGTAWALIHVLHVTRDSSVIAFDQIFTIQAPTDGTVAAWSIVGSPWSPGFHEAPGLSDWTSVILSDRTVYWNHYNGTDWGIYSKTI